MFTVTARRSGENNKTYSYRILRDAIMYLELKPGQALSEVELAEALNISRTPIREVLTQLKEEHLIEVIPQVGTYVTKINPQLIEEAAFMRFILEKEVLRLACSSFPESHLQRLKQNLTFQDMLRDTQGKEREFHKLDNEFHGIIFHGLKNEHIWNSIHRLSTHYNRVRLLSEFKYGFNKAIDEHHKIVEIIENKQVDQVEQIVYKHILEPKKNWHLLFDETSPFYDYIDHKSRLLPLEESLPHVYS